MTTALKPYENTINPQLYTTEEMKNKREFLSILKGLTQSMGKGFKNGQDGGVASNKFITIFTQDKDSSDIDTANITLASPGTFPANEVVLGASLKSQYSAYSCAGGSEQCASVLISSWEVRVCSIFMEIRGQVKNIWWSRMY